VVNLNDHLSKIFNYKEDLSESESNGSWYSAEEGGKYFFNSHHYTAHSATEDRNYPTMNVRDYNRGTEWRTAHSPGLGESLALKITPPVHVDQIGIIPGCGGNKREWSRHSRIKELEIIVNGKYTASATLPDEYISFAPDSWKAYELVNLPEYPGNAINIRLTIRSVYPGNNDQVTCISEVLLRQRLKAKPKVQGVDGKYLP
jgi:hypothetical protein